MARVTMFKLITGEVVVSDAKVENEKYILNKPVELKFEPMSGGLSFLPYMAIYLGKELESVELDMKFVMHVFDENEIPDELLGKYTEFLTGIVTDTNSEIITGA